MDSRPQDIMVRRRRRCLKCAGRFTTREVIVGHGADRTLPQLLAMHNLMRAQARESEHHFDTMLRVHQLILSLPPVALDLAERLLQTVALSYSPSLPPPATPLTLK
jgi:hypothetical protein